MGFFFVRGRLCYKSGRHTSVWFIESILNEDDNFDVYFPLLHGVSRLAQTSISSSVVYGQCFVSH